jgi:hypothetical protein
MALTLIKEDGTGMVDANSYASAADGDAYHDGHLYATAWNGATTQNREKALVMATRLIDGEYQFNGFKLSDAQALQWPRERCPDPDRSGVGIVAGILSGAFGGDAYVPSDLVPAAVVRATCELARELIIADRTAAPPGEGVTLVRAADQSETIYNKRDKRPVIPMVAQSLLCKYGALLKRAGVVRLVRG